MYYRKCKKTLILYKLKDGSAKKLKYLKMSNRDNNIHSMLVEN